MTTNMHDKMLAAIDAYFSASDAVEEEVAENLLLDVRDELLKQPAQQEPLTDEKYEAIVEDLADWGRYVEVDTAHQSLEKHVRQVLIAHGIKENT